MKGLEAFLLMEMEGSDQHLLLRGLSGMGTGAWTSAHRAREEMDLRGLSLAVLYSHHMGQRTLEN